MPALRLLLFGTPGVGKSSLLGALAQAAPMLKADLIDPTGALQQLQEKTYGPKLPPTDALESYSIRVQPTEKVSGPYAGDVTVLDCSGKSALDMLEAKMPFADSHPLKKMVLDADAVVIVTDVSLGGKQLTEQFRLFAHWLKQLHAIRGQRTDIAELPVYFVLNKCDLLAKKDDTNGTWIKHIEEIKGKFDENFRKFLKQETTGFGTLKLKLSATAIKRPALADKPAKSQEPYGVAELFRECLRSANDFQERRHTAQSRLQNIVAGLIGLVALLGLTVSLLVEFQPHPRGTTLDEKVQAVLPKLGTAPMQGTSKKLEDKKAKLSEIEGDADFARLPAETREAVKSYRQDLSEYLELEQNAPTVLKLPYLAKNDADLKEMEKSMEAFKLPENHAKDWADTRLGRRLQQVRKEYESLHAAAQAEDAWVHRQIDEDQKHLISGLRILEKLEDPKMNATQEAEEWQRHYRALSSARPPTPREENVPGVSQLLYDDLGRFEPLKTAQKTWRSSKDRLANIAKLIDQKLRSS